jgi:hypothetical protein
MEPSICNHVLVYLSFFSFVWWVCYQPMYHLWSYIAAIYSTVSQLMASSDTSLSSVACCYFSVTHSSINNHARRCPCLFHWTNIPFTLFLILSIASSKSVIHTIGYIGLPSHASAGSEPRSQFATCPDLCLSSVACCYFSVTHSGWL